MAREADPQPLRAMRLPALGLGAGQGPDADGDLPAGALAGGRGGDHEGTKGRNGRRRIELCEYELDADGGGITCRKCRRGFRGRLNPDAKRVCTGEKAPPLRLVLKCPLSPGDILTLTAAIHSLHRTYPGKYLTDVDTPCPAIFEHNPDVGESDPQIAQISQKGEGEGDGVDRVELELRTLAMHYPAIHRSNHELTPFLAGYTEYLGEQLGRPLKLRTNRPHLYLSETEAAEPPWVEGKFWLVNAGVKRDFPLKQWPVEHFQAVVDHFRGRLTFVQIGEAHHDHVPLAGVVNLIGKTSLRELIVLAYHAAGGLGPITFLQHLCAAWQKPYVALLGGREPVPWVTYPLQHTLHTIGTMDCCRAGGCWKGRLRDCVHPVTAGLVRGVGECMKRIEPAEVVRVIERVVGG